MTMENKTAVTSFLLMAYSELEDHRYLYFTCLLFLYILIFLFNSFLIFVIYYETDLHEPMFLFLCNLSFNSVYGITVFLPPIVGRLISQNYEILVAHCLLQTYSLYLYGIVEYTCLAVMAYDRYIAICYPLHYQMLMTPKKTFIAIVLSWIVPCVYFALYFITTVRLSFCDRHLEKVYCSDFHLHKLSCFDTSFEKFLGRGLISVCPGIPFVLILFSYAQILRICLFAPRESQIKALQTCTPHLVTMINFTAGVLFELTNRSFDMSHVPYKGRIFLSLYFWILPPLFNPIIYGITIQAMRIKIIKMVKRINSLL